MKRMLVILATLMTTLLPASAASAATIPAHHPGAPVSFSADAGVFCSFPVTVTGTDDSHLNVRPNGTAFTSGYVGLTITNDDTHASFTRVVAGPGHFISADTVQQHGTWMDFAPAGAGGPYIVMVQGNALFHPATGQLQLGAGARLVDVCQALA